jgi:hypothetical protein
MKQVKITNATVIPFIRSNTSDPLEIVRVMEKKPEYNTQMVIFNVETKVDDNPSRKARLFERCTIYAKTAEEVKQIQSTVTNGLLVEIEGRETRVPGKEDPVTHKVRYYNNVVVNKITPISGGVPKVETTQAEDDLPF